MSAVYVYRNVCSCIRVGWCGAESNPICVSVSFAFQFISSILTACGAIHVVYLGDAWNGGSRHVGICGFGSLQITTGCIAEFSTLLVGGTDFCVVEDEIERFFGVFIFHRHFRFRCAGCCICPLREIGGVDGFLLDVCCLCHDCKDEHQTYESES